MVKWAVTIGRNHTQGTGFLSLSRHDTPLNQSSPGTMPTPRISMPKIIAILRLKYDAKLSHQEIAHAVGLSKGAIGKYVSLAAAVGLHDCPLPERTDEATLECRLFSRIAKPTARYIEPDWFQVHQELKRKGVTLLRLWAEHEECVGDRAHRYTQFSQRYRAWKAIQKRSIRQHHRAGEKVFIDHCGPSVPVIDRRPARSVRRKSLALSWGNNASRCRSHRVSEASR